MTAKIVPFIFNWSNQFENAKRTEDQLREICSEVFVVNSDPDNSRSGWIDVGEDAYYTEQFLRAVELFDGDFLFQVQSDASYHNWQAVLDNALKYFEKYNWGVFAPNVDFTGWGSAGVNIESTYLKEPELSLVSCTDCTCWFIHRDTMWQFINHKSLFSNNKYGWGIDLLMAALSYFHRKPVIRDYGHTIVHPRGCGYDNEAAMVELKTFMQNVDDELKPILHNIINNPQALLHHLRS